MKKIYLRIKVICLLLAFTVISGNLFAQVVSVKSGDAGDPTTWSNGTVPRMFEASPPPFGWANVTVKSGHTVEFAAHTFSNAYTLTIESGATLKVGNSSYVWVQSLFSVDCRGAFITRDLYVSGGGSITVTDDAVNVTEGRLINYTASNGLFIEATAVVSGTGEVFTNKKATGSASPTTTFWDYFNQWNGASSTDWETAGNWYGSVMPTAGDRVFIDPDAVNTNMPVIDGDVEVKSVNLCGNDTLTIGAGGRLELTEWLCARGELKIESDASGSGNLITPLANGPGTIKIDRYIPTGGDDWHIISCPISGVNSGTFAASEDVYFSENSNDYDLAPYIENLEAGGGGWGDYVIIDDPDTFGVGKGYVMRRVVSPSAPYVTFSGLISNLEVGTVSQPVTAIANGWNGLGNPYSSTIRIRDFVTDNSGWMPVLYSAVYLWDPVTGDYIGLAGEENDPTIDYVAVGQGFLVKSDQSTSAVFNTDIKLYGGAVFKSAEKPWPIIKLTAVSDKLKNTTTVKFNGAMTNDIDRMYDLGKLKGNPDIALYTQMPDNSMYDLQDQALPDIDYESLSIPVGLDFAPGGEVIFSIETEALPGNAEVYLEDTENGSMTLLNVEGAKYTTTVAADNSGTGRFNLIIEKYTTTGIDLNGENEFTTHTQNKTIFIDGPATKDTEFELYSIEGRCWYIGKAQNINRNTINGSTFPLGVYVLRIKNYGDVQSTKLVLTEN